MQKVPTHSKPFPLRISLGVDFGNCYNKRNSGTIINLSEVTIFCIESPMDNMFESNLGVGIKGLNVKICTTNGYPLSMQNNRHFSTALTIKTLLTLAF